MSAGRRARTMDDRGQARLFVVLVLAASWSLEAFIIAKGGVGNFGPLWIVALMCIPGAVSVAMRLVLKTGFGDAGLRIGKGRFHLVAVAVPLALALPVALVSAVFDIRQFAPAPVAQLVPLGPVALSILALGLVGAFGEELGWRGFLLPKMVAGGVRHPYLASGLVWAAWHLPLIAFGGFYRSGNALLMALVYGTCIVAWSCFLGELRMRSGSVWPATLAHAAHNFIFQFAVPVLLLTTAGSRQHLWELTAGDSGLLLAALYVVAYFVLRRSSR